MHVIELPPTLDIRAVVELKTLLARQLDRGGPLALDAGAVARIDASALQLLAAFFQEAAERGVEARWQAASEEVRAGARLTGLRTPLNLN